MPVATRAFQAGLLMLNTGCCLTCASLISRGDGSRTEDLSLSDDLAGPVKPTRCVVSETQ